MEQQSCLLLLKGLRILRRERRGLSPAFWDMHVSDLDPGAKQAASQSGRQGPGQNLQVNLHCKRHGSHLAVERLSFLD